MAVWTWDPRKNLANQRKHRLSFEKAQQVFDDPLVLSRLDGEAGEERWQSIGLIDGVAVVIVHTWREIEGGEIEGRIISARKATRNEKRIYEEGRF
jgi:uncharacterized DUF497 family protein